MQNTKPDDQCKEWAAKMGCPVESMPNDSTLKL